MIKGVNKNIIEVSDTGNRYFEKVILFVKPEYSDKSSELLKSQAQNYISSVGAPHNTKRMLKGSKKTKKRKKLIQTFLLFSFIAAAILVYALFKAL